MAPTSKKHDDEEPENGRDQEVDADVVEGASDKPDKAEAPAADAESVASDASEPNASEPDASEPNASELDDPAAAEQLSDEDAALLDEAANDLVADMRSDMLRAQAELVNFRSRVERDRAANREAVIAEVIRSLLPAVDDLSRAEKHGDLEGSPLEIVAVKLRTGLEKFGLRVVGAVGDAFDPHLHEAVVQFPSADVKVQTVAEVIDPGYALGERLLRAAKVAVSTPAD